MATESPSLQTLLGMGLVIAATLVVGGGLGWLVDSLLDTLPVFVMVGLFLGIVGAVVYTVTKFREYLKN